MVELEKAVQVGRKILDGFAKGRARANAATVGQKVLDGAARGRAAAMEGRREEMARKAMLIVVLANQDREAGRPARGLAGRISRKLHGKITRRLVGKYLARLGVRADSLAQDERHTNQGGRV
jgi:hypothetical protein